MLSSEIGPNLISKSGRTSDLEIRPLILILGKYGLRRVCFEIFQFKREKKALQINPENLEEYF